MNKVAVLISAYNGEKFIRELLDSLSEQTYRKFDVIIRDDGSNDKTMKVVEDFTLQSQLSLIMINDEGGKEYATPELGLSASFFKLVDYANSVSSYSYFLFCDQDDVWHKDKVEKMVYAIKDREVARPNTPLLIHSDLRIVDKDGGFAGESFWKWQGINPCRNSTSRLLIQNTVTGCATIMNRALSENLKISPNLYCHDYRTALVASLIGEVVPLHEQLIDYRQHGSNTAGAGSRKVGAFENSAIVFHLLFRSAKALFQKHHRDLTSSHGLKNKGLDTLSGRKKELEKVIQFGINESKDLLSIYGETMNEQSRKSLITLSTLREKNSLQRKWLLLTGGFLPNSFYRSIGLLIVV